jgi:hypothetical protein
VFERFGNLGALGLAAFDYILEHRPSTPADDVRKTAVWADIVRCRIENSRNSIVSTPVESIQYPARDLQQLLVRLVGELEHS